LQTFKTKVFKTKAFGLFDDRERLEDAARR